MNPTRDLTSTCVGPFLVLFPVERDTKGQLWFCCDRRSGAGVELTTQELDTYGERFEWDHR